MELPAKGSVTPLSSLFPAEEAQKASKRVQDTIAERQKELDQLRHFITDNASLMNLVQKLPDELHHDIMVPFGKAAFFPGRLIHTNEFLVLLGEGYYSERTSKQTIDILNRRGKALESQVESLKAVMQDLKAEASFFDATAAEVAEGLVEIREEYVEGTYAEKAPKAAQAKPDPTNFSEADRMKAVTEDEEYAKIMSRFDELEEEELAAESVNEDEEYTHMMSTVEELEKKELATECVSEFDEDEHENSFDHEPRSSELYSPPKQLKGECTISEELPTELTFQQDLCNRVNAVAFEGSNVQSVSEEKLPSDQHSALTKPSSAEKAHEVNEKAPEVNENVQAEPRSKDKAFTGSIVEHTHNFELNPREQMNASPKSNTPKMSKPVSRFKMQRR